MKQKNILDCEKIPYKERLKQDFRENSMLYKFYIWLRKINKKKKADKKGI